MSKSRVLPKPLSPVMIFNLGEKWISKAGAGPRFFRFKKVIIRGGFKLEDAVGGKRTKPHGIWFLKGNLGSKIHPKQPSFRLAAVQWEDEVVIFQIVGRGFGGGDDVLEIGWIGGVVFCFLYQFEDGGVGDGGHVGDAGLSWMRKRGWWP